jgi:hypothetical protein
MNMESVEALQPFAQHRAVPLLQKASSDVDHSARVDPEEVPVVRKVVDRAKREAVDDGGDSRGLWVVNDVRCLD